MRGNCLFLMCLLLVGSPAMGDGIADRDVIVSRMSQYLDIILETNTQMDDECLTLNLEHPNYQTPCCSGLPPYEGHCSDILWHEHFLNGIPGYICWWGMPYSYGGDYTPDDDVQGAVDECRGLGNHWCHYTCTGCDWSAGSDCSAAVSWALGMSLPKIPSRFELT